jgi:hypothetical protein
MSAMQAALQLGDVKTAQAHKARLESMGYQVDSAPPVIGGLGRPGLESPMMSMPETTIEQDAAELQSMLDADEAGALQSVAQTEETPEEPVETADHWTVKDPEGNEVASLGSPDQTAFREHIATVSGKLEGENKELWDEAGKMFDSFGLPFHEARHDHLELFKFLRTQGDAEKRAAMASMRRSRGGSGPPAHTLYGQGEAAEEDSMKRSGEYSIIDSVLTGNQALDLLEEAKKDPQSAGAIVSNIVYMLARTNDPGARQTDKDIMMAMGFTGTLQQWQDSVENFISNRGVSDHRLKQIERILLSSTQALTEKAKSNYERRVGLAMRRPSGEYRRGGTDTVDRAYSRLGFQAPTPLQATQPAPGPQSSESESASVRSSGKGSSVERNTELVDSLLQ